MKISFSEPLYHITKNRKTTVCVYYCEVYNYINNTYQLHDTFTVVGKSTCNDKDVFDIKAGRRLAECKAKRAAYSKAMSLININKQDYIESINTYNTLKKDIANYHKMQKLLKKEEEHFHKLLKKY